jgi:hypothetical protein
MQGTRSNDTSLIKHKWFAHRRTLNVTGEAFGTRKRFLGRPTVSWAGWVGTINHHSTMAEGEEETAEERRHSCCGWTGAILKRENYIAQTTKKNHVSHQNNLMMW